MEKQLWTLRAAYHTQHKAGLSTAPENNEHVTEYVEHAERGKLRELRREAPEVVALERERSHADAGPRRVGRRAPDLALGEDRAGPAHGCFPAARSTSSWACEAPRRKLKLVRHTSSA